MNTETLEKLWNASADQDNQWSVLSEDEKIEFALAIGRKNGLKEACEICGLFHHGGICKISRPCPACAICREIRQRIEELP